MLVDKHERLKLKLGKSKLDNRSVSAVGIVEIQEIFPCINKRRLLKTHQPEL